MKEIKTFFAENVALNKGYTAGSVARSRRDDNKKYSYYRKRFENTLPPIEVMSQYEEMYPGVLKRLIDLVEQEQQHNQAFSLTNLESYNYNTKRGQTTALIAVSIICCTTILLGMLQEGFVSFAFFVSAFSVIAVTSILSFRNSAGKKRGG